MGFVNAGHQGHTPQSQVSPGDAWRAHDHRHLPDPRVLGRAGTPILLPFGTCRGSKSPGQRGQLCTH